MPFDDPREPWLTRGILISLASLFDLCKGLDAKFEGNGNYKESVPGEQATRVMNESGKIVSYIADSEFFEECIQDIRSANTELSKTVSLLNNFAGKISTRNLINEFISPKNTRLKTAIQNANITDSISDFTLDFKELTELAGLLKASFRNRRSHRKLKDSVDQAFLKYHHALLSRFLQLVNNCWECTSSRGWVTSGQSANEQGDPRPLIENHIEEFEKLTQDIFTELGPPLHYASSEPGTLPVSAPAKEQPVAENEHPQSRAISKADLYEIVDAIRETHDESGSYIAWLEERMNSLLTSTADDLKNALLKPWKDKDIEDLLNSAARTPSEINPSRVEPSPESKGRTIMFAHMAGFNEYKILNELKQLCREIKIKLHEINPRFEFYNCIVQRPIVEPAIKQGVCSYNGLKQTDEFISRIIKTNNSFMLDEQERMYQQRIDQILSKNRSTECPF